MGFIETVENAILGFVFFSVCLGACLAFIYFMAVQTAKRGLFKEYEVKNELNDYDL